MRIWLKPGNLLLFILLILPLIIAFPRVLQHWQSGTGGQLRALALVSGVLGMSMMMIAATLSLRLPKLDRYFGGLPHIWLIHRGVGFGAFVLIMLHAWLLGFANVPAGLSAALNTLFPPFSNWPVWAGWLALLTMLVFLGPTFRFFGRPPHYQRWKKLHLLSALATVLAIAHVFPLARELWIWVILAALAIGAIVWRKVLSPQLGRYEYEVTDVRALTRDVVEISFRPKGKPMKYEAGQFVYLTPMDPSLASGHNEEHPYTISSAPDEDEVRIGIKDLGDASHALQTVKVGTKAFIEGPYGDFFARDFPERKQLWLGGGIGITPFVGGSRALQSAEANTNADDENVHLFYLANDPERSYYLDELLRLGDAVESLAVTAHYFRQYGPLTDDFLREHCPDFADREVYMCGPPGMTSHLRRVLMDCGIPQSRIHSEAFDFL